MTREEILSKVVAKTITADEALKLLEEHDSKRTVTMKVSEKGCVTFRGVPGCNVQYGFSPRRETLVWLYANQKRVEAFLKEHKKEIDQKSEASRKAKDAA